MPHDPALRRQRSRRPASRGPAGRARASARARAKATAAASQEPRARSRLTGRAAILVLVMAVLVVSYASSLRAYLQQRTHIEDLSAKIAEREQSIDDLEDEKARWDDPAFLESQARQRFGYVAPGERSYVVLDENGNRVQGDASLQDPSAVIRQEPTAWWSTAWESVELAGDPPKIGKPPAAQIDGSTESSPSQD